MIMRKAIFKAYGDVAGLLALEQFLQGVDKAEHGRRVDAGGRDARAAYHGVKCPEDERIGVEQQQFLVRFHYGDAIFTGHKGSKKFSFSCLGGPVTIQRILPHTKPLRR